MQQRNNRFYVCFMMMVDAVHCPVKRNDHRTKKQSGMAKCDGSSTTARPPNKNTRKN